MNCKRKLLFCVLIGHSLIAYGLFCCLVTIQFLHGCEFFCQPLYAIGAGFYSLFCIKYIVSLDSVQAERKVKPLNHVRHLELVAIELLWFAAHVNIIILFLRSFIQMFTNLQIVLFFGGTVHFAIHCYMTFVTTMRTYKTGKFLPYIHDTRIRS